MGSHFGVGAPPIFRLYFSGDWDVHWGYGLDFDPWPMANTPHKQRPRVAPGVSLLFHLPGFRFGPLCLTHSLAKIWADRPPGSTKPAVKHHGSVFVFKAREAGCGTWAPAGRRPTSTSRAGRREAGRKALWQRTERDHQAWLLLAQFFSGTDYFSFLLLFGGCPTKNGPGPKKGSFFSPGSLNN